jgi:hypothetical protein
MPQTRVIYVPLDPFTQLWIHLRSSNLVGFTSSDEEGQFIQLVLGRVRPLMGMKIMSREDLTFAFNRLYPNLPVDEKEVKQAYVPSRSSIEEI